jgi:hypothetical protein
LGFAAVREPGEGGEPLEVREVVAAVAASFVVVVVVLVLVLVLIVITAGAILRCGIAVRNAAAADLRGRRAARRSRTKAGELTSSPCFREPANVTTSRRCVGEAFGDGGGKAAAAASTA